MISTSHNIRGKYSLRLKEPQQSIEERIFFNKVKAMKNDLQHEGTPVTDKFWEFSSGHWAQFIETNTVIHNFQSNRLTNKKDFAGFS